MHGRFFSVRDRDRLNETRCEPWLDRAEQERALRAGDAEPRPHVVYRMDRLGARGTAHRAPREAFRRGLSPRYPRGGRDLVAYMKSSGGETANRCISTTASPTHAWMYGVGGDAVLYAVDLRRLTHVASADEVLRRVEGLKLAPYGRYWMAHLPDGTRLANLNTGEWIVTGRIPAEAIVRATIYRQGQAVEVLENPAYLGDLGGAAR